MVGALSCYLKVLRLLIEVEALCLLVEVEVFSDPPVTMRGIDRQIVSPVAEVVILERVTTRRPDTVSESELSSILEGPLVLKML